MLNINTPNPKEPVGPKEDLHERIKEYIDFLLEKNSYREDFDFESYTKKLMIEITWLITRSGLQHDDRRLRSFKKIRHLIRNFETYKTIESKKISKANQIIEQQNIDLNEYTKLISYLGRKSKNRKIKSELRKISDWYNEEEFHVEVNKHNNRMIKRFIPDEQLNYFDNIDDPDIFGETLIFIFDEDENIDVEWG